MSISLDPTTGIVAQALDLTTPLAIADGGTGTSVVPAFSAYRGTSQSISGSTDTIVLFNTKVFDITTSYDTGTGRFQPLVGGYYQLNSSLYLSASTITLASARFLKNGTVSAYIGTSAFAFNSTPYRFSGSTLVYLNGSTDYVTIDVNIQGAAGWTVGADSTFQGVLVRAA